MMDPSLLLHVGRLPAYRTISKRRNPRLRAAATAILACLKRCSQRESRVEAQTTDQGKVHTTAFRTTAAGLIVALLGLIMISSAVAGNGPTALICTDKMFYFHGDTLKTSVSAWNYGREMTVDVYVALFTPFGVLYILQDNGTWDTSIMPCLEYHFPSGCKKNDMPHVLHDKPFVSYPVPPTIPKGWYGLGIVLTKKGAPPTKWICDLNGVFFYIADPIPIKRHRFVDGTAKNSSDSNSGKAGYPWKTITHALSQVNPLFPGDAFVIHVAQGTYDSAIGEQFPLELKPFVYLRGAGAKKTILNAEGKAPHVILCSKKVPLSQEGEYEEPSQPFSIVEGFTIKGGIARVLYDEAGRGGGVYCPAGYTILLQKNIIEENEACEGAGMYFTESSPILHNNIVRNNVAELAGGGILAQDSSWASLIGNTIRDNKAGVGGGIHCGKSDPEIRNNFLISNVAGGSPWPITCFRGGGIDCDNSSPFIAGNMIKDNTATGSVAHGGGIFCNEGSQPIVRSNAIIGNKAEGGESKGGGIACVGGGDPKLLNSVIRLNFANGVTTGDGGGIYCRGSRMKVRECTFILNEATTSGGGVFTEGSRLGFFNNLMYGNSAGRGNGGGICCDAGDGSSILYSTIAENSASNGHGGGVFVDVSAGPMIAHCILYDNTARVGNHELHGPSSLTAIFNCIKAWRGGGRGNISGNPKFTEGPFSHKYYLDTGSPCIDAGWMVVTGGAWPGEPKKEQTTDALGSPDEVGTHVDMGRHYLIP